MLQHIDQLSPLTYEEFKQAIANKQHLPDYYLLFHQHINNIVSEVAMHGKVKTATSLGLTTNAFTPMLKLSDAITRQNNDS